MIFIEEIGKIMDVYVDDMIVNSVEAKKHVLHLDKMFNIAREYEMKLNPLKCTFGVRVRKILGFIVHQGK